MGSNVKAAATALPLATWEACGVRGRPFAPDDLESLISLGSGDEHFAWERRVMDEPYFEGLLQFRLGHYWRYGFGVHALLRGGEMVGQAGLQVLDEEKDRVEFVVFLGAAYVGQGIGSCLAKALLDRCVAAGMSELYGVVRSDNPEGKRMVQRLNPKLIGTMNHFHHQAEVYVVRLGGDR